MNVSFLASDLGKWDARRERARDAGAAVFRRRAAAARRGGAVRLAALRAAVAAVAVGARGRQAGARRRSIPPGEAAAVSAAAAGRARRRRALRREGARTRRRASIADKMRKLGLRALCAGAARAARRGDCRRAARWSCISAEAQKATSGGRVVVVESAAGQKEAAELARSHDSQEIASATAHSPSSL